MDLLPCWMYYGYFFCRSIIGHTQEQYFLAEVFDIMMMMAGGGEIGAAAAAAANPHFPSNTAWPST